MSEHIEFDLGALSSLVNSKLHDGSCPDGRALGECPAMYETFVNSTYTYYYAHVYVWKRGQGVLKPRDVASWFEQAGAKYVTVSHHLEDSGNFVHDGVCEDGAWSWLVDFTIPNAPGTVVDEHESIKRAAANAATEALEVPLRKALSTAFTDLGQEGLALSAITGRPLTDLVSEALTQLKLQTERAQRLSGRLTQEAARNHALHLALVEACR